MFRSCTRLRIYIPRAISIGQQKRILHTRSSHSNIRPLMEAIDNAKFNQVERLLEEHKYSSTQYLAASERARFASSNKMEKYFCNGGLLGIFLAITTCEIPQIFMGYALFVGSRALYVRVRYSYIIRQLNEKYDQTYDQ